MFKLGSKQGENVELRKDCSFLQTGLHVLRWSKVSVAEVSLIDLDFGLYFYGTVQINSIGCAGKACFGVSNRFHWAIRLGFNRRDGFNSKANYSAIARCRWIHGSGAL